MKATLTFGRSGLRVKTAMPTITINSVAAVANGKLRGIGTAIFPIRNVITAILWEQEGRRLLLGASQTLQIGRPLVCLVEVATRQ
jgi:hypothetical protein